MRTNHLAGAAFVLALVSAALGLVAYRRSATSAASSRCDCDAAVARAESRLAPARPGGGGRELAVSALADRVDQLERRLGGAAAATPPTPTSPARGAGAANADGVGLPRFASFKAPRGVTVTQAPDGRMSVTNSDPALANQMQVVEGTQADGTVTKLTFIIPPPK